VKELCTAYVESGTTGVFIEEHSAPFATPGSSIRIEQLELSSPGDPISNHNPISYLNETLLSFDESGTQTEERERDREEEIKGEREREKERKIERER